MAVNDWIDFLNPIAGLMSGTYLRGKKNKMIPTVKSTAWYLGIHVKD